MQFAVLLIAFLWSFSQVAGAQGTGVNPFQEHDEELSGAIWMVEPNDNLLILERNSIPYKFVITPETQVTMGMRNRLATLEDLAARKEHWATVRFTVTHEGNIAKEIHVGGWRTGPCLRFRSPS
jgi:hypothetical protein